MEPAQDILEELVCVQCGSQLRRSPVFQRQDGAACSPCQEQEGAPPAFRNHVYEAAARALAFPCRYREEGCPASVPFKPAGADGPEHEAACEYRLYMCPVLGPEGCDWAGRRDALLQHCEAQHPDAVSAGAPLEECGRCGAPTARLYQAEDQGWLCEACAPALETCDNDGCDFQDFPWKRGKHSGFWCEQRNQCWVCDATLQPGTLTQHYQACGRLPEVPAGAGHRVPRGPGSWFRVEDVLCWCGYPGDRLELQVYAPVAGHQLSGYRCEVRLEGAGHTRTYTPPSLYHMLWDWDVECKDSELLTGDITIHVSVTRADST